MKIFRIFCNHKNESDIKLIKSGFYTSGLIFGHWWTIYHRVWALAIPLTLLYLFIYQYCSQVYGTIFQLSCSIGIFILSEDILACWFETIGYKFSGVIYANSEEEAMYKYLASINDTRI